MKLALALLFTLALALVPLATGAPDLKGTLPGHNCADDTGVLCNYQDCHPTTDPECRDGVCVYEQFGKCYLDPPI